MSLRRTIGISLACFVMSAGAIAKTPERSASHHSSHFHGAKPGKMAKWFRKSRTAFCSASHVRSHLHNGHRVRHWYAGTPSTDSGSGPADTYLGAVHPIGQMEIGTAAWYNWVGSRTASGEVLDSVTPTAAHRSLPLASYAKVTNLDTGRSVIVKINDRGPWHRRFIIDLSPRAAAALDVIRSGIAAVIVEPVAVGPAPPDAAKPTVAVYQTSSTAVQ
jgi:rare lipoprotein A (peptidoglycan hydrolase)